MPTVSGELSLWFELTTISSMWPQLAWWAPWPASACGLRARLADVVLEDALRDHGHEHDRLGAVGEGDRAGVDRVVHGLRLVVGAARQVDAVPAAVVVVVAERLRGGRGARTAAHRVGEVARAVGVLVGLLEAPQARPAVDARAGRSSPRGGSTSGKSCEVLGGVERRRRRVDLRRADAPRRVVRLRGCRHHDEKQCRCQPDPPSGTHSRGQPTTGRAAWAPRFEQARRTSGSAAARQSGPSCLAEFTSGFAGRTDRRSDGSGRSSSQAPARRAAGLAMPPNPPGS